MNVTVQWFSDQFNVNLSSKEGKEPFLQVKGCRIVNGSNGPFVSYPATKNASTGKWWSHAYGSEEFNAVVLEKAQATQPRQQAAQQRGRPQDDDRDPIPF